MLRARFVLLLACLWLVSAAAFAAGIPIRGRVLDSGGAALAKVRVRLVPVAPVHTAGRLALEGRDGPEPVASAESAADGSFLLEAPEPGMWKVVAGGEGLVPQEIEAAPLTGELDLPSVRLQRDAGLTVRVLGADGKPVPGARVRTEPTAFSSSSPWQVAPRSALTDAEGRAVLPRAASAAATVRAGASGFGTAERKEVRAKTLDLRLPTGPTVPLRVLGADGKPAAGVLVLRQEGGSLGMTGEDGLLDLVAPGGAPLDLLLLAADGRRLETRVRPFQPGEPQTPRELRLPAAGEAAARVTSAADGRPLAGALVWRTDDPGSFRRTDARGETRLPAPSERDVAVQSAAAGFLTGLLQVQKTEEKAPRPLAFSLQPDLVVTGVVVDEAGDPVAGAEITSSVPNLPQGMPMLSRMQMYRSRGALVRSGPDGRFRWAGLVADLGFELRVAKAGFAPTRVQATSPSPERPTAPLRIVLRRGRSAFGRVLGPDQRPIAGAQVTLKTALSNEPTARFRLVLEPDSLDSFSAATGTDGRFDLRNLPTGRYDLTVRGRGWAPLTVPSLEVPEGNRATDLGTVVLAPGVALEGFVVDAAGKPVEGAEIRVADAGETIPFRLRSDGSDEPAGLSGVDGFFRIEDLRSGSPVDVSASRTGYAPGDAQGVQVPADPPIRLILQAVGTVSGRVVDPDGEPIAGAHVRLEIRPRTLRGLEGGRLYSNTPQIDRSDAEGNFRITDVIPGPVGLSAQASGWQAGTVAGLELRGGEEKSGIEIVLSPAAILKGRVLSPSGRPLPGAQVQTTFEDQGAGLAVASTDSEGVYVLDTLPPGNRTLEATHPDHGAARRQVELRPGENSLDFSLEGGSEVTGRVVDDAGAPVAGAHVTTIARGIFRSLEDTSEADGSFRFTAVADGTYEILASKEGFATPERAQVTVAGSSVGGIEIRLSPGGAIVGRIAGVELSELSRIRISARGGGRGLGSGGRVEPDGSYRIDHLREGEWRVRAELPGTGLYAEGVARLEPGASEARLDLEMERGLELSGRIRRNGAPVTGEPLSLQGSQSWTGQTDAEGRFRFQGLAAGSYHLYVGDRSAHEETVDLQTDREITIELSTGEVRGRVMDAADARPLADVTVQLVVADSGSTTKQARTDSRGVFVLHSVAEGSWRLRALADGYAPGEMDVRVDRASPTEDVEITLQATEGVTLQVATAAGPPPRSLVYVVMDGAGRKVANGMAAVGNDGRARLSRVPLGGWQVLLLAESTAVTEIAVTAPGDAGRLTLPPPCVLRVKVRALMDAPAPATVSLLGAGGRPFRAFRMGEPATAWDLDRGAFSFRLLPPGTWEVQVTAADGRTWRTTVTTAPGVEAEAVME